MAVLLEKFDWREGPSLRGVWSSPLAMQESEEDPLQGCAYFIRLDSDSDPFMESTNFSAFLPLCVGGVHGAFADGDYWMVLFQVVPEYLCYELFSVHDYSSLLERQLQRVPDLKAIGSVDERWYFDADEIRWDLSEFVSVKVGKLMQDWTIFELIQAAQAQLCNVPLKEIVRGRITQCAYPNTDHDCQHDVFRDVFAQWGQSMQGGQP